MKLPVQTSLALVAVLAVARAADAGPRRAFEDRRVVSASGATYAVLVRTDHGIRLSLHRRRTGAPPITAAIRKGSTRKERWPAIDADPGDGVLASARVRASPTHVLVADEPAGVLLFDSDGALMDGKAAWFIDARGHVAWARQLGELVSWSETQHPRFMYWNWCRGLWLGPDPAAYLATRRNAIVRIALANGAVSRVGPEVLSRSLGHGTPQEQELVLDLTAALALPGVRARAEALARDEARPLGVRVRAASLARAQGSTADFESLFARAISPTAPKAVRHAALERIAASLGSDTFSVIVSSFSGTYPGDGSLNRAARALASLEVPLLPRLDALRRTPADDDTHALRLLAHRTLDLLGTAEARELLWDSLVTGDPVAANSVFHMLVAANPKDLKARLIAAWKAGSPATDSIRRYLMARPNRR